MLRPVPTYPGYFAKRDQTIWSIRNHGGKLLPISRAKRIKPFKVGHKGNEYLRVSLYCESKYRQVPVATIMLETFVCPRPKGMLACHGIRGRFDNSLDNLYWGTREQNMKDKYRDGTDFSGERNPRAILNTLQVRIIVRAHQIANRILTADYLSSIFHVCPGQIYTIFERKEWKALSTFGTLYSR